MSGRRLYIVHADWCHYCVYSMPVFQAVEKLASRMNGIDSVSLVESSQLNEYRFRGLRQRVSAFPSIMMQEGRKWRVYNGPRTVAAIKAWAQEKNF